MTIDVGDRVPSTTFMIMKDGQPTALAGEELFRGRKVALFCVPGAFTPTCSAKHLPGYVDNAAALKLKGIDVVVCLAVNDVFVMDAWGRDRKVADKVFMVADGSGAFVKAAGLELDLTEKGLGVRGQRFSAIVEDGVVTRLNVEEPGAFSVSDAETMLKQL